MLGRPRARAIWRRRCQFSYIVRNLVLVSRSFLGSYKYPGSAVLILYRKNFSAIVRLGRAELPTVSIKHTMFPAFFDPRVLRNREKTGPGDQTLAKSYDIGKLTRLDSESRPPQHVRPPSSSDQRFLRKTLTGRILMGKTKSCLIVGGWHGGPNRSSSTFVTNFG